MKLAARDVARYFGKPDPHRTGVLIYGADAMRVAERRKMLIDALIGPDGETEMRLTRIEAAELRKDPAMLIDAIKARGFFPGPCAVHLEGATDGLAKTLTHALEDWAKDDAQVIVTAAQLPAKSALRKLFEAHANAYAIGIYDDPPSREDIEQALHAAGLHNVAPEAMRAVQDLAMILDPGDFRQTIEKTGLYTLDNTGPVTVADIDACRPQSSEADIDDVLACVAGGRAADISSVLRKLYAQGVTPVTLCIGVARHFRLLFRVASDKSGVSAGIGALRPPVFGPRRDMIARQAGQWGSDRLEKALTEILNTELALRSASKAPQHALTERMLVRLAMMVRSVR